MLQAYVENPADFPLARFIFAKLVAETRNVIIHKTVGNHLKMTFDKKDIEPLDFILNHSLLNEIVTAQDLINEGLLARHKGNDFAFDVTYNPVDEFVRYLQIIDDENVCECSFRPDGEFARKNSKTWNFRESGGFRSLHKKRNKKSLDWYRIIPIILTIGFGISTIYFANVNYDLKLNESRVPLLEQKIDSLKSELSELRKREELNKANNNLIESDTTKLSD